MPTVNKLTDNKCRAAKSAQKAYKLFDGSSLYLFVSPTGAKIWRYTYRIEGKAQTAILGPYPLLSLADARSKRDDLRRKLLDGVDLKAKPRKSITFAQASAQYWAGRKDVTLKYLGNATRGLDMHLGPTLGAVPIGTITRAMLLEPLIRLDACAKHVYARRIRVWASQVFEWAKANEHCKENPAALIDPEKTFGRKKEVHHASLKITQVSAFLLRLSYETELQSVLACHLLALTWVRTVELRKMRWSEIEGDLWRIPGARMKMGKEHLVPLSRQALALLDKLKMRSPGGPYVFPSDRRTDRTMSENAILYLMHRIGYKGVMTGHGWRSVGSTWANEGGYSPDAIERQLAHSPKDDVRAAYNNAAYLPARRVMLQDWADWLERAGR